MYQNRRYNMHYLRRTLPTVPRDLWENTIGNKWRTLLPTVLTYNVTFVCQAQCVMCDNWRRGKEGELTLAELDPIFRSPLFRRIENIGISGGDPIVRSDLPEIVRLMVTHLPSLRKVTIVTAGLNPRMALQVLTPIVRYAGPAGLVLGLRVSLDGVGKVHDEIRQVPKAFDRALETIEALQALQKEHAFGFGISATITPANFRHIEQLLGFVKDRSLDVVFNFVRFTEATLGNLHMKEQLSFSPEEMQQVARFFRERVRESAAVDGDAYIYANYARMIENGFVRTMPCPFVDQGIQLNPEGDLYFCENSRKIGNVRERPPKEIYFDRGNLAYREGFGGTICRNCLSPCHVGVSLRKKVYPYVWFLLTSRVQRWTGRRP